MCSYNLPVFKVCISTTGTYVVHMWYIYVHVCMKEYLALVGSCIHMVSVEEMCNNGAKFSMLLSQEGFDLAFRLYSFKTIMSHCCYIKLSDSLVHWSS